MALHPNNTIYIGGGDGPGGGGGYTAVDTIATGVAATPGMLAQRYVDGAVTKWRPHANAAGTFAEVAVYVERPEHNQGIDDPYEVDELARVYILQPGSVALMLVPSGQNIADNDLLESNGDGMLKEGSTAPIFRAAEGLGAVTAPTRIKAVRI